MIDEVCGCNSRARLGAPLFVASFWNNVSCRRTLYIYIYMLRRVVQQYSILTCTQAFAGKSVPVITLMNGNKGRRGLYRAILCSLRGVLLRAVLSPSFRPASLFSHCLLLSALSQDLSRRWDRFLRHYIVANCSTNFEIISPDNEVRLHNGLGSEG